MLPRPGTHPRLFAFGCAFLILLAGAANPVWTAPAWTEPQPASSAASCSAAFCQRALWRALRDIPEMYHGTIGPDQVEWLCALYCRDVRNLLMLVTFAVGVGVQVWQLIRPRFNPSGGRAVRANPP